MSRRETEVRLFVIHRKGYSDDDFYFFALKISEAASRCELGADSFRSDGRGASFSVAFALGIVRGFDSVRGNLNSGSSNEL
jgi:hypothetical protein